MPTPTMSGSGELITRDRARLLAVDADRDVALGAVQYVNRTVDRLGTRTGLIGGSHGSS
ncbi:hypothetical protein ACQPXH_16860 [Nocardia sp. CA-135953]|uniref:hypothetical protein n=1 Tax=Nocardia sp. CA-135953 TaxID=3239978 RepID=UPI003D992722